MIARYPTVNSTNIFYCAIKYKCLVLYGFEGKLWDLIVSDSNNCLIFYFPTDFLVGETL